MGGHVGLGVSWILMGGHVGVGVGLLNGWPVGVVSGQRADSVSFAWHFGIWNGIATWVFVILMIWNPQVEVGFCQGSHSTTVD